MRCYESMDPTHKLLKGGEERGLTGVPAVVTVLGHQGGGISIDGSPAAYAAAARFCSTNSNNVIMSLYVDLQELDFPFIARALQASQAAAAAAAGHNSKPVKDVVSLQVRKPLHYCV
jgi:hypothetical protein